MKKKKPTKRAKPAPKPRGLEVVVGRDNAGTCTQIINHDVTVKYHCSFGPARFVVDRPKRYRGWEDTLMSRAKLLAEVLGVPLSKRDTTCCVTPCRCECHG